jgi:hypothetical protein
VQSAFVVWDGKRILEMGKVENSALLGKPPVVSAVAIESIKGYGMTVGAEVFETCRWEGKFELFFDTLSPIRVARRDVKDHICMNAKAKDKDVIEALTDRIGPKGTKKDPGPTFGVAADIWAALAVAVFVWDTERKPPIEGK